MSNEQANKMTDKQGYEIRIIGIPLFQTRPLESKNEASVTNLREPKTIDIPARRATTASILAYIVVCAFAVGVLLCFLFSFILFLEPSIKTTRADGSTVVEKDFSQGFEMFKTFSALMAGPLGFVLGFYFRETQRETQRPR